MCAYEKRIESSSMKPCQFAGRVDSRFADSNAVFRNMINQLEGSLRVNLQRFEVAIIDADDARSRRKRPIQLFPRVNFHERFHGEFSAEGKQFFQLRLGEHGNNK